MNYDIALNAYMTIDAWPNQLLQPNKKLSNQDKSGRWILRNTDGFLAYVTTSGKVLNRRFEQIGGAA